MEVIQRGNYIYIYPRGSGLDNPSNKLLDHHFNLK